MASVHFHKHRLLVSLGLLMCCFPTSVTAIEPRLETFSVADGEGYFALLISSWEKRAEPVAIDLALVLDLSASQSGKRREVSIEFVQNIVNGLVGGSRVQVWLANKPQSPLLSAPVAVGSKELKILVAKLAAEVPTGASDLPAVVAGVTSWLSDRSGSLPKVVLSIGDGDSSLIPFTPTQVEQTAASFRLAKTPWCSLRIGGASPDILAHLAGKTGGRAFDVSRGAMEIRPTEIRDALQQPVIFLEQIQVEGSDVELALPRPLPSLRPDSSTLIVGRWRPADQLALELKGISGGGPVSQRMTIQAESPSPENGFLKDLVAFWAKLPAAIPAMDGETLLVAARKGEAAKIERDIGNAQKLLANRDLAAADKLFQAVLAQFPDDPQAKSGRNAIKRLQTDPPVVRKPVTEAPPLETVSGTTTVPRTDIAPDPIADAKAQDRIEAQRLHRVVRDAVAQSQKLVRTDPEAALRLLKQALAVLDDLPESDAAVNLKRRLEQELRSTWKQSQRLHSERLGRDKALAQFESRNRSQHAEITRQQQTKALMDRFSTLLNAGKEVEAERMADRIVEQDPQSLPGHAAQLRSRFARHYREAEQVEVAKQEGWWRALTSVDESAIPFDDRVPLVYPPAQVWEELSIKREKYKAIDLAPTTPAEDEIRRSLARPVTFDFAETPLSDVVNFLKDYTGVNVILDMQALEQVGVDPDTPVTLSLTGVTLRSALRLLLRSLELSYIVKDEVLLITSYGAAEQELATKVYPVGDLVTPIGNFSGGGVGFMSGPGGGQGTGLGQGQGQGGFNNGGFGNGNNQGNNNQDPDSPSGPKRRPNRNSGDDSEELKKIIEQAAGDWEAFLPLKTLEDSEIKDVLATLNADGAYADAVKMLQAAIRHRESTPMSSQTAPPWMFEALGLSMQLAGAPVPDVESAYLSLVDLAPGALEVRRRIAEDFAAMGAQATSLELLRATALIEPSSANTYLKALKVATGIGDVDHAAWAANELLSRQWPRNDRWIHDETKRALANLVTRLRESGETSKSERLDAIANAVQIRDLEVTLHWQGETDVDLCVVEPGDLLCSPALPQTVQGGVLLSDQEPGMEKYVAAEAFSGDYELLVRSIWGTPTGGRVTVDVVKHRGTDRETKERHTITLEEGLGKLKLALAEGRRQRASPIGPTEELAIGKPEKGLSPKAQLQRMIGGGAGAADNEPQVAANLPENPITSSGPFAQLVPVVGGSRAVLSGGAVAFDPVVSYIQNGPSLTAQAVVSADRRYVRMTLVPVIQNVQAIDKVRTVPITGVAR